MENQSEFIEELVVVGSRYGDLADVVKPLYEKGEPIDQKDIKDILGDEEVYLSPISNTYDSYAVGVFTLTQKRLGYLWMYQSPAISEWMKDHNTNLLMAKVTRVVAKGGLMMAQTSEPVRMSQRCRNIIGYDLDWARNIPFSLTSITEQTIGLGISLLLQELERTTEWSDRLQMRIDNLLRDLPLDLSAQNNERSIELFNKMRTSTIPEMRWQCDLVLSAFVCKGSGAQMQWWVKHWLPSFFQEAAETDLLAIYEAAHYTLERVEELLDRAPAGLFYLYQADKMHFGYQLYYASLPQSLYNRLLTLLAVREMMIKKQANSQNREPNNKDLKVKISNAVQVMWQEGVIEHKYDFTWLMMTMNEDKELPSFDTPTSYLDFMRKCGVKQGLPDRSTISKYYDKARGHFPNWTFDDADTTETIRRNNVGKRFLNLLERE